MGAKRAMASTKSGEETVLKFPRGQALPSQSPIFWVQQKDRYLRQLLIKDIEEVTGRRLVVYFANRFRDAQIDQGDVAFMAELLGDLKGAPTDLLLETNGGFTDATEAVVSLLQAIVTDLRVIVVNAAKSNGTMICLAASEIVMGPTSELGPIDPHLNGTPASILSQDVIAAQNYPLHQLAVYAIKQTEKLAKRLLQQGMMEGEDAARIDAAVVSLSTRSVFFSHGSVIDHKEATQLGLKVRYLDPDDDLWQRLWLLHCMYAHDVTKSGYLKVFEGAARSTSVAASA